jgi:hypothetical protein
VLALVLAVVPVDGAERGNVRVFGWHPPSLAMNRSPASVAVTRKPSGEIRYLSRCYGPRAEIARLYDCPRKLATSMPSMAGGYPGGRDRVCGSHTALVTPGNLPYRTTPAIIPAGNSGRSVVSASNLGNTSLVVPSSVAGLRHAQTQGLITNPLERERCLQRTGRRS